MQQTGHFPYMVRVYRGCFLEKLRPHCLYGNQVMCNSILGGKLIHLPKKICIFDFATVGPLNRQCIFSLGYENRISDV